MLITYVLYKIQLKNISFIIVIIVILDEIHSIDISLILSYDAIMFVGTVCAMIGHNTYADRP